MGILDEAIREHLELKRQHGADDSELKQLEDQAFGQPERPTRGRRRLVEAPTEFMSQPRPGDDEPGRRGARRQPPTEPPSPRPRAASRPPGWPTSRRRRDRAEDEPADQTSQDEPADEAGPRPPRTSRPRRSRSAAEHEAIAPPAGSHTTEERHAIADQPTEMFDVEEEFAATEVPAPPDEDLVAEEIAEARLGPAEPDAPLEVTAADEDEDEDDDFFDEQRLSDELDQALEAPADRAEPLSRAELSDEHEAVANRTDEHEVAEPRTEVHEARRPTSTRRRPPRSATPTRTCSRRRPTSSRRHPRTTSSGSSRSPRRTSTSTTRACRLLRRRLNRHIQRALRDVVPPSVWRMAALKRKGDIAEMKVAVDLLDRGCQVSFPFGEDCDYDLIADHEGVLHRVQVKYTEVRRPRRHLFAAGRTH